jgi:hypothetical protein
MVGEEAAAATGFSEKDVVNMYYVLCVCVCVRGCVYLCEFLSLSLSLSLSLCMYRLEKVVRIQS